MSNACLQIVRFLYSDLRASKKSVATRLLAVAILAAVFCFLFYYQVVISGMTGSLYAGDFMCAVLGSDIPFESNIVDPWEIPMVWLLSSALILFITLDHPLRELSGVGRILISVSGNRWGWWIAKCLWVTVVTSLACGVVMITCLFAAVLTRADMGMIVQPQYAQLLGRIGYRLRDDMVLSLVYPGIVLWVTMCSLALLQQVISLVLGTLGAYLLTVAQLFLAAFFSHPLLLANYLMLLRADGIYWKALPGLGGFIGALCLSTVCVVVGGLLFVRRDILSDGREL